MSLQDSLFAIDRVGELRVFVKGLEIPAGIDQDGNVKELSVDFQIDQLPPTVSIELVKIPSWIDVDDDIWIDGGYDGFLRRIFTGRVKKRRHSSQGETLDCVGMTSVLTKAYLIGDPSTGATFPPKQWVNQTGLVAVEDILDDLTPPFINYDIDPSVADILLGSVKTAVLDVAPPSDMIHDIVDMDGHRIYESPTGMLIIRPLLEAPAPVGLRAYTTDDSGVSETAETTDTYDDTNIDTALNIGDVLANTARGQGVTPSVSGTITQISVWLKKVGAPTDKVHFELRADDGTGLPGTLVLGGAGDYPGMTLETGAWTKVTFNMPANPAGDGTPPSDSSTVYHIVISRSGALDAVNYYTIGADTSAPSYAGGGASQYNDTIWSAVAGTDTSFEMITKVYSMLRILDISDDEDPDQVKKKVYVYGASIASTDSEGNEISVQIYADAETISTDLVEGAPELYSMRYQSHLIDYFVQANKTALRLLDKYHRELETVQMIVPFDPLVTLGSTITLDDPIVTGKTGNWWVFAYKHVFSQGEFATEMSLYGGDQSGTTGNLAPFADFKYSMERELIGNSVQVMITFVDESKDYGGSIVYYHWTDTYSGGAMDIEGPDVYTVTRVYDPSVDDTFTVTLTVTDNLDLSRSMMKTIELDINEGSLSIFMPQLSCAAGNTCMFSPDGGFSWVDIATPSGVAKVTEMFLAPDPDDIPYMVFGTDNGRIYRTIDGNLTLTLELDDGAGNPIADIVEAPLQPGRLWALTTTGRVHQSVDWGDTWTFYANLGSGNLVRRRYNDPSAPGFIDPTPSARIRASTPLVNRIWVAGGDGTDPATWFVSNYLPDGPNIWESEILPGAFPPLTSSGDASDTVIDTVISHGSSSDLGLLFSGRDNPPKTMYIYGPPSWYGWQNAWSEASGLPAGVDGRGVEGNFNVLGLFLALFDNKNAYRSIDGSTWDTLIDVLPGTAANRPNSLHQLAVWWGLYVSAQDEGIAKTPDFGDTWTFLRPNAAISPATTWPGGAIGYDVSFEYTRPRSHDLAILVESPVVDAENALALRTQVGDWQDKGPLPTARDGNPHQLWHFSELATQPYFYVQHTSSSLDIDGDDLYRSVDGITWVKVLDRVGSITLAPNGVLWASSDAKHGSGAHTFGNQAHVIYKSIDEGVIWTEVYEDTTDSGGAKTNYMTIAADPVDANRIMFGGVFPASALIVLVFLDATVDSPSPSRVATGLSVEGIAGKNMNPKLLPGQHLSDGTTRWILGSVDSTTVRRKIRVSDNNGAAWTLKYTEPSDVVSSGWGPILRAGNILYFAGTMLSSDGLLVRSIDNGDAWSPMTDGGNQIEGLDWNPRTDTLYVTNSGVATTHRIKYMQPPTLAGTWLLDPVSGLETAMGYATDSVILKFGMVVKR